MKKRPTIQMVADSAGVSRGTVDRVLNKRANVSPEVFQRVMDALEKTGYLQPQQIHAQAIEAQKNIHLGVVIPAWTGIFKIEILRGIQKARDEFEHKPVEITVAECQTDTCQEFMVTLDKFVASGIQGIAICAPDVPTIKEKINKIMAKGIPVVTFNSDIVGSERLSFVGQNYYKSGRIAGELIHKLINNQGHIIASVGNLNFHGHKQRLVGFQDRMTEMGVSQDRITVVQTYNDYTRTYDKIKGLLGERDDIVAIYMANRSISACAEAVKEHEKKGLIKIVCHDLARNTKLLLADGSVDFTISHDMVQQGYQPLCLLYEFLSTGSFSTEELSTTISIICSENI